VLAAERLIVCNPIHQLLTKTQNHSNRRSPTRTLSSRYLHTYTSFRMGDDQMLQSVLMVNSPALQMGEDWMLKQDLPRCFVNNLVLDKDLLAADVH
jgi:hypothetical protein